MRALRCCLPACPPLPATCVVPNIAGVRLEFAGGYSLLHAASYLGATTLVQLLLMLAGPGRAADTDEGELRGAAALGTGCAGDRVGQQHKFLCHHQGPAVHRSRGSPFPCPQPPPGGRTPAYLAASQGHMAALRVLLEAAPQTADQPATINHWCPHMVAAKYGRLDAVRLLLQRSPGSAAAASLNGRTAAHLAAENNQAGALRLLLAAAPETARAASLVTGSTPLHSAARNGATDALRILLAAAPEATEAADLAGMLPLHTAAFHGHAGEVQLLLEAAPCTAQCTSYAGLTPLRCGGGLIGSAIMGGQPRCAV